MIEKIDQIKDLLIVPSVDEQPRLAINQMKILNLLIELRAEIEQCNITDVAGTLPCDECDDGKVWSPYYAKYVECDCRK